MSLGQLCLDWTEVPRIDYMSGITRPSKVISNNDKYRFFLFKVYDMLSLAGLLDEA